MKKFNSSKAEETVSSNGKNQSFKRDNKNHRSSKTFKPRAAGKPGSSNDPSWYAANEQLLKDVASFPFSYPLGMPIAVNGYPSAVSRIPFNVSGMMMLRIAPSFGRCVNAADPLNVAAATLYSYVRHANSGSRNYNDADLMIYILAMDQVYSAVNWLQRIYDSTFLFAQRNQYLGDTLLRAQGVDPAIRNELANFRAGINQIINKVTQFAVPNDLPLFRRHAMLFSSIYAEGESVKDQLYLLNPAGFYKFQLQTVESVGAGSLGFKAVDRTKLYTSAELLQFVEDLVAAILADEDFSIISGDILKAYQGNIIKMQAIPEFTPLVPITDLTMLEQVKNATAFGTSYKYNCPPLQQNATNGLLSFEPQLQIDSYTAGLTNGKASALLYSDKRIMGTILVSPTPADVIERSRLMCVADEIAVSTDGTLPLWTGTEVVTHVSAYTLGFSIPTTNDSWSFEYIKLLNGEQGKELGVSLSTQLCNFRFHPMVRFLSTTGSNTKEIGTLFDADNFTVLDLNNLKNLHMCAIMSLLGVNSIAKF